MAKPLLLLGIVLAAAGLVLGAPAEAATHHRHASVHKPKPRITRAPAHATYPSKDAALIEDGATGKILYARNANAERHPASLTKMMTLYLLFEALKSGRISMQTPMPVSRHASLQKPTKLYLRPGQTITVDKAIRAIVVRSANDVAVVIAEALGGTELHFAQMMTKKARALGMHETYYHNASGLPDRLQITTAKDLALLARHLAYDFPQYFWYFALPGFTYKGHYYPTHDNLIGHYQGADGMKTGYTNASGFNLTTSVVRNGVHLIGIVMGGRTAVRRDREMMHLLDVEFAKIDDNPTMVARGPIPWEAPSDSGTKAARTEIASKNISEQQFAALSTMPPPVPDTDDEDAAESMRAPDENFSAMQGDASDQASITQPSEPIPPSRPAIASSRVIAPLTPAADPVPRPATPNGGSGKLMQASSVPEPKPVTVAAIPKIRPSPVGAPESGDQSSSGESGHNWTIQIGAFADRALARAQLDAYAHKSRDVLGQAARLVIPFQASDGQTMYRARFGLFAEQQARRVCDRLTQRGQTCFAAISTR